MAGAPRYIMELERQQERTYDPVRFTISERWILQERLGKGGFGVVYSALDKQSGKLVAVKMEIGYLTSYGDARMEILKHEYEIMEKLNEVISSYESLGFPHPIYYASSDFMRVLVMDLLGKTIHQSLKNFYPKMVDVYNVGIQLLCRLEHMHNVGFVHLDLKTDNIFFGRDEEADRVYLADFGLCERYLNKNGTHRMNGIRPSIVGTTSFSSRNVMHLEVPSRRDDIESLGYVLIFMYFKTLPWMNFELWHNRHHKRNPASVMNLVTQNPKWEAELLEDNDTELRNCGVREMKSKYSLESLSIGLPGMKEFMEYACGLEYEQIPDYELLRHTLARKIGRSSITFYQ